MSQHRVLSSATPSVLTLHGFPQPGSNPPAQFAPIRQALSLPPDSWHDFTWIRNTAGRELRDAYNRLRDPKESFSAHYAADLDVGFDPWFHDELKNIDSRNPLVILAYSLGALILFKWLEDNASSADVERITTIFCLAGPYRFRPFQHVYIKGHRHPSKIAEKSVSARQIGRYLRRWQLVTLLAEDDGTFAPWNCLFRRRLIRSTIDQHVIAGPDHETLCAHPATLDYIRVRFHTQLHRG